MSPGPAGRPERHLAVQALRALTVVAVVAASIAGSSVGWQAALSALIGTGFVGVLFIGSVIALSRAVGRSPGSTVGIMVGGSIARIALYGVALAGLAQLTWIHRPSLALATAAAFVVTLAFELRTLARTPQLFWIDAQAGRRDAVGYATRSSEL